MKNLGYREFYSTIEEMGADLDLMNYEIAEYFKYRYGQNFYFWRKKIRISDAMKMLSKNKELPASEVGRSVGIPDRSNFRREFYEVAGVTPSEWREMSPLKRNLKWTIVSLSLHRSPLSGYPGNRTS